MGAIQIAGVAEGLAIAEQAGLDMQLVLEAIETGVAASPQVIRHARRMVARNFAGASFTVGAAAQGCRLRGSALAESLLAESTACWAAPPCRPMTRAKTVRAR